MKKQCLLSEAFNIKHSSADASCCKRNRINDMKPDCPALLVQAEALPHIIVFLHFCRLCCSLEGHLHLLLAATKFGFLDLTWKGLQKGTEQSYVTRDCRPLLILQWHWVFYQSIAKGEGVKVKLSRYKPGQALGVPGGWGSRISRQLAHESRNVSPTHRPSLPPGRIPGTHFC
jgi:hypothetical protein